MPRFLTAFAAAARLLSAAVMMMFFSLSAAAAEDGLSMLRAFLQNTPAARIVFRQTALDESGEIVGENSGRFWHLRPRFFRMEYDPPDALIIVSDGDSAWTYEPDLNQAVVRRLDDLDGAAVLLETLAAGDLDFLQKDYALSSGLAGKWRWAVAEARDRERPIQRLRLGFAAAGGELRRMELLDAFGGTARLDIDSISRTPPPASLFRFTPPADAAILRQ